MENFEGLVLAQTQTYSGMSLLEHKEKEAMVRSFHMLVCSWKSSYLSGFTCCNLGASNIMRLAGGEVLHHPSQA